MVKHPCSVCGKAIKMPEFIRSKITSGEWEKVACPECWGKVYTTELLATRVDYINSTYSWDEEKWSYTKRPKRDTDFHAKFCTHPDTINTRNLPNAVRTTLGIKGMGCTEI